MSGPKSHITLGTPTVADAATILGAYRAVTAANPKRIAVFLATMTVSKRRLAVFAAARSMRSARSRRPAIAACRREDAATAGDRKASTIKGITEQVRAGSSGQMTDDTPSRAGTATAVPGITNHATAATIAAKASVGRCQARNTSRNVHRIDWTASRTGRPRWTWGRTRFRTSKRRRIRCSGGSADGG